MKRFALMLAALVCCLSCVESSRELGGSLIPVEQTYKIFVEDSLFIKDINLKMADSLSGYSQSRITIGAVRDSDYGLTTRAAVIPLVPMFADSLVIGNNPKFKSFHFAAAKDTISYDKPGQDRIFQRIKVYELSAPVDPSKNFDCNASIAHSAGTVTKGYPYFNGGDSLSFNLNEEFAQKYLSLTAEDMKDYKSFLKKCPGIYIETDEPAGEGGRIDIFELQLGFESSSYVLSGNLATLNYSAEFDGEVKDTTLLFYYGATGFYKIDSLLSNVSRGSYPQYSLNLTGHETRGREGKAQAIMDLEGGGGIKPVISAKYLKQLASEAIIAKGGDPAKAVINKARLVFPYEFPDDYREVDRVWPQILSPTSRIKNDTLATYIGLSDTSSESENHGDINRSTLVYSPDITFHLQEILKIDESDPGNYKTKNLNLGNYDVWLIVMSNIVQTTTNTSASSMSDYYNYLAYQSYYNSMYGGYGGYGYGGYGYGGYGGYGSYYNNYYSYMMMAQYAQSNSTTTTTSVILDKDMFYRCHLNGPEFPVRSRRPRLELTFSLPNQAM